MLILIIYMQLINPKWHRNILIFNLFSVDFILIILLIMNPLPQIFRQTHNQSFKRQGPNFFLQLGHCSHINSFMTTHRSTTKNGEQQKFTFRGSRYSNEKETNINKSRGYSTISYEFLNDQSFYQTKQKRQNIQSIKLLIHENHKALDITNLKMGGLRGTKQLYLKELKDIQIQQLNDIHQMQSQIKDKISRLRSLMSQLRKQTRSQIKFMKQQTKIITEDLIVYCQEINTIDQKIKICQENIQKIIQ